MKKQKSCFRPRGSVFMDSDLDRAITEDDLMKRGWRLEDGLWVPRLVVKVTSLKKKLKKNG